MPDPVLSVKNLCVDYITGQGPVRAVDHVTLDVQPGEILGVAGESGSGKSTLAQAVLRILPPPAVISGGSVHFKGQDLLAMGEEALRAVRWRGISMVFQSAMDSLNPVLTVEEQLLDTMTAHGGLSPEVARTRAAELFDMVNIPVERLGSHPHQLSGGMRQRVGIALALALEPSLVILDEPTTALDVMVEAEILTEIKELQQRLGFAVIFITHDLARMLQFSDRVAVFYAARLAEVGDAARLQSAPGHPYTRGLLGSFPSLHPGSEEPKSIPGSPPSLRTPPGGCRFHPRCPVAEPRCQTETPPAVSISSRHVAVCHLATPRAS